MAGEPADLPDDAVQVGRVVGAWGVQGGIKVKPFASDPQALFSSRRWFIRAEPAPMPGVAASADGPARLLKVTRAREQGEWIVATCQDLADRDAAQALSGSSVYVSRASFPTPSDDEFYWVDLIGSRVLNRQNLVLGTVVGLVETGPHCVLRVQPEEAEADERLVPFVSAYVDRVDLPGRTIQVDWSLDF